MVEMTVVDGVCEADGHGEPRADVDTDEREGQEHAKHAQPAAVLVIDAGLAAIVGGILARGRKAVVAAQIERRRLARGAPRPPARWAPARQMQRSSGMRSHRSIAVWLDHQEARVFHVNLDGAEESLVSAPHHPIHRHPKGSTAEHHHPEDLHRFFHDVTEVLRDAEQILVVGPSTAKLQLLRYLHEHARDVEAKVVGIETVDHPTDRQLAAYAMTYFKRVAGGAATPARRA